MFDFFFHSKFLFYRSSWIWCVLYVYIRTKHIVCTDTSSLVMTYLLLLTICTRFNNWILLHLQKSYMHHTKSEIHFTAPLYSELWIVETPFFRLYSFQSFQSALCCLFWWLACLNKAVVCIPSTPWKPFLTCLSRNPSLYPEGLLYWMRHVSLYIHIISF